MRKEGDTAPETSELKTTLTISGRKISATLTDLPQAKLIFYRDNPRVYSVLRGDSEEPTQDEIQDYLIDTEHVRELREDIKRNGGLIEPVVVKDETFEVLEGNCRLAAYRLLAEIDPVKWNTIKSLVLPSTIQDDLIFALLGQYHIRGRKDWMPYEKAGFLYRRRTHQKIDIRALSREIGESAGKIKHLIETYEFMMHHGLVDPRLWSYFDEYLKSSKIGKSRKKHPEIDEVIIGKIRSSEIDSAVQIRDQLPLICIGPKKNLKRFIAGQTIFGDAVEIAEDAGGDNAQLKRLAKFRSWLAAIDVNKALSKSDKEVQGKLLFEIDKIQARLTAIRRILKP